MPLAKKSKYSAKKTKKKIKTTQVSSPVPQPFVVSVDPNRLLDKEYHFIIPGGASFKGNTKLTGKGIHIFLKYARKSLCGTLGRLRRRYQYSISNNSWRIFSSTEFFITHKEKQCFVCIGIIKQMADIPEDKTEFDRLTTPDIELN